MTIPSADEWQRMPIIARHQNFTRRKFQEMENMYYSHIEELIKKLDHFNEIPKVSIPDFTLHTFSFIKEWQYGEVDTKHVYNLLKGMNLPDTAEKTICRRLKNFMNGRGIEHAPDSYAHIKAVHDRLQQYCVPLYLKYLELLLRFFEKMYLIDQSQIRLTWIEQIFKKTGEVTVFARDITLNQMYRELDSSIFPNSDHKYILGDNVIVFDENLNNEDTACHWIFGPQAYIAHLKDLFNVVEKMDLSHEKEYLKRVMSTFI